MRFFGFLFFILMTTSAQARVFNLNNESFAAYFLGTGGVSQMGSAFDGESGTGVTFSDDVKHNYSGEFGFLYSHPRVGLRFGFEIIKPEALDGVKASSGANTLYSASSDILAYAPKLTLEVNLQGTNSYRSFASVYVGSANITMRNDYALTSAGQAAFPGVVDHGIEAKGSGTLIGGSLGYEGFMTDTTTVLVEFGYRQLKIDNLKYTRDEATFSGDKKSGDPVLTSAGIKRELDLSGVYLSLGFRFYL